MHTITYSPPQSAHEVTLHIGNGSLEQLAELFDVDSYSKLFIVTDKTVAPLLLEKLQTILPARAPHIVLPAGEAEKHIQSVEAIWTALHEAGCDRKSLVINLGGGVIGDIGGFAASTYMRGIAFVNIPTTILAQVDASVGGKNGFDFGGIKNLIGTFSQPVGVLIDPLLTTSLPERELVAGFGEIIKHGLIWDAAYFVQVTAKKPSTYSHEELEAIIARSCAIKLEIIESDIFEQGPRKIVNFGHTIGHAVEALSLETDKPLLHGEAISIGMLAEAALSAEMGLLGFGDLHTIEEALAKAGLPVTIPAGLTITEILVKLKSDKKNRQGVPNFTLLEAIGHAVYDQTPPETLVHSALQAVGGEDA